MKRSVTLDYPYPKRRKTTRRSYRPPRINSALFNKGEVKTADYTVALPTTTGTLSTTHLTAIDVGDTRQNRNGNEIHLLGVDIDGYFGSAGAQLGVHIVSPTDNHTPAVADFIIAPGAAAQQEALIEYYRKTGGNQADASRVNIRYRFKYPLKVIFNGTTTADAIRNRLFIVVTNFSAFTATQGKVSARLYFQDD